MFKRIIWVGTGMVAGASGAFWAKRKVEETVERYLPEQVAVRAASSARGLGATVKAAATEGRAAMKATEAELRQRVEARTFVGERPEPERPAPASSGRATAGRGARRSSRTPAPRQGSPGPRRQARR